MPATSKAQARFMRAVASGSLKRAGLGRAKAAEYVAGHPTRGLPERRRHRLTDLGPGGK